MSKTTTTNGVANGAAASGDWMSILRINKKDLIILSKKVNLKFDTNLAIPDPLQRLVVTLRYLVTGEGYHVDLAETFMGTYMSIFAALESNLEWPASKREFEGIAEVFQSKWQVPHCLGALCSQRFTVEVPLEYKWIFETDKGTTEFTYGIGVDANYRLFFGGMVFHGICPDDQIIQIIEPRISGFPDAKAPTGGSGKKLSYSFVGCDTCESRPWLRVLSSAKSEAEKREIRQGLRPGEIATEIMTARFGVLKNTIRILRPADIICLTRTIAALHNHFLVTNPRYAVEYKDVDQLRNNLPPMVKKGVKSSMKVSVPCEILDEDKSWMDQMHMDKTAFKSLWQATVPGLMKSPYGVPPTLALRVALRYMATGKGYDQMVEMMLVYTFKVIGLALQDYEKSLPLTEKKWLEMATGFEKTMNLPNCAGIFVARLIGMGLQANPLRNGCLGMILDSTGRIAGSRVVSKGQKYACLLDLEDEFMQTTTFRLPKGDKKFLLIGEHDSQPHAMLATPERPGHFTREELERGQKMGNKLEVQVFQKRFQILNGGVNIKPNTVEIIKVNSLDGFLSQAHQEACLLLCKMHNFLMDKSATYGDVFKKDN